MAAVSFHPWGVLANGLLVPLLAGSQLLLLFGVPWLLAEAPWRALALAALLVLLTNSYWALLHDAFHASLFPSRRWNDVLGRGLAIVIGAPFRVVRWGHLLHHAYSRTPRERTEVYVGERPRPGFVVSYLAQISGGLYLYEVLTNLLLWLPRSWLQRLIARIQGPDNLFEPIGKHYLEPRALWEIRADAVLILLLYGAALWCWGPHWPWLVLVLVVRGFLLSVADNAYHYQTALGDPKYGMNLSLPRPLQTLLLNFNLHGVHHAQPHQPWYRLPGLYREQSHRCEMNWFVAVMRQYRGPLAEHRLPQR